ncbi:MAG: NFACT RNA binding domain-containing protein [Candidatus Latescibacterota bacterium]
MAYDFVTLRSLAADLDPAFSGRSLRQAAPTGKGLLLVAENGCRAEFRGGRQGSLCLLPAGTEPPGRGQDQGPERYLVGARVEGVSAGPLDRLVTLILSRADRLGQPTYGRLVCELIPGQSRAVLVSDRTGQVLGLWGEAGRRPAVGPDDQYLPPQPRSRLVPSGESGEEGYSRFAARLTGSIGLARRDLAEVLALVDPLCAAELLHRAGLPTDVPLADLDEVGRRRLWQSIVALWAADPESGAFAWEEAGRFVFSALEPTRLAGAATRFGSVSEACRWAEIQDQQQSTQRGRQRQVGSALHDARRALARKLEAMEAELDETIKAPELERAGAVLLAHLAEVPAGATSVDLPDAYDPAGQARVRIALDPTRTAAQNASRFLKTARRYARRAAVLPQRLAAVRSQAETLDRHLDRLSQGAGPEELTTVAQWLQENGMTRAPRSGSGRAAVPEAHPRRYRTSDGWSVWAGRNNQENDLLSHRLAAPNDLWFHAHGYAGAHVLLRREGRKEEPSQRAVEEAAAVAAYWSKGKTARKVPVSCTLAKYVSKPRGAPPGQALIRRERTLMVQPALLPEEDEVGTRSVP